MGRIAVWLFAAVLGLVGITLTVGGGMLAADGGSLYYVATGLAVLVSAFGLLRGWRLAAGVFGAMLAGTIVWSLWEVGLDSWALMPRLVGPAVVGLLFLLPGTHRAAGAAPRWWVGVPSLAGLLLVAGAVVKAETAESGLPGAAKVAALPGAPQDWQNWGGRVEGTRYAAIDQIGTGNVKALKLAWRYDSDIASGPLPSLEAAPLAVNGRLYMCIESGTVAALDQDTGKRLWQYRGLTKDSKYYGWKCRGVAYYAAKTARTECTHSLYMTTADGQLIAIDADTGRPCSGFASNGIADLRIGMGLTSPDDALPTSPPTVVNGVIVVGQSISDYGSFDSPSGVIRGYDAETGALRWAWDAGRPGQTQLKPGETYTRDTPNAWGVFSGDEKLGLVYVGTGNSPPDYYSAFRSKVADQFTDNVVAIDVATGQLRWSFRTVNHDLWDYDIAAQPVAIDLADKAALLVPTKRGEIFVLDRATGQPIDPVVQKRVPQGGVKGEWNAPTQPYTTGFPSVSGADLTEADMWGLTPIDQMMCRIQYRRANYKGQFTPITTEPTITYPAVGGGINWGSVAVDTQRGLLVVNALHFANINRLVPRKEGETITGGFEGGVITFPQTGTPYGFKNFPFLSAIGVPCQKPPFGTISVFDIKTRKLVWSKPLGTAEGSGPLGIASHIPLRLGAPNFGGSLTTAGGLVFIAAGQDRRLRAFDIANGKALWSAQLPAVGAAMPISYVSPKGRQFVVIAAGGHFAIPGPKAAAIMAYALPK
ncbi:PQQ-binding-like beta-propeller repeat protein [Novosphingobium sp. G106]|uniref:outer membrane protein assembly factor BamB family protein n=1 Tax=Novosphingobium sp. G106 TaxID=2849500 RepID=UPI001C2D3C5C|nr:PQQ-binding-like beta-propeller repeat protein [Novosphingobium sp. G106]MBV1691091.1 PQQ-binding-like beta-propeller repeat protein [Novosphingobium sp. G106]